MCYEMKFLCNNIDGNLGCDTHGKCFLNVKIHWNAVPPAQIWNKNDFLKCFCICVHRTEVFYKRKAHANK